MKIVALIGEPASGKTTIARELLSRISKGDRFKTGLISGTIHHKEKIIVLGLYDDGQLFAGTDRLSMAVQPAAQGFVLSTNFQRPDWSIFFEGDRLGNLKFLSFCKGVCHTEVFVIDVNPTLLEERHKTRGDAQTEVFIKGRRTKVANIRLNAATRILKNERQEDISDATLKILGALST